MTTQEFSDAFDTLLQQQLLSQEVAVDEYEKSLFLTQAQKDIVLSLYNGTNSNLNSFEKTEEARRYLAPLVKTKIYKLEDAKNPSDYSDVEDISSDSHLFQLPEDIYFIIYEKANVNIDSCSNIEVSITPTTHDEYNVIKRNPFRTYNNKRGLRLDITEDLVEVITKGTLNSYFIRYVCMPSPIILVSLQSDNLSIEGQKEKQTSELPEVLHDKILKQAVALAIATKFQYNSKDNKS